MKAAHTFIHKANVTGRLQGLGEARDADADARTYDELSET